MFHTPEVGAAEHRDDLSTSAADEAGVHLPTFLVVQTGWCCLQSFGVAGDEVNGELLQVISVGTRTVGGVPKVSTGVDFLVLWLLDITSAHTSSRHGVDAPEHLRPANALIESGWIAVEQHTLHCAPRSSHHRIGPRAGSQVVRVRLEEFDRFGAAAERPRLYGAPDLEALEDSLTVPVADRLDKCRGEKVNLVASRRAQVAFDMPSSRTIWIPQEDRGHLLR